MIQKENIWLKTVYSETLADVLKKIDAAKNILFLARSELAVAA